MSTRYLLHILSFYLRDARASVELPRFGRDESVNDWLQRITLPRVRNDSLWWQYQHDVIEMCRPLWTKMSHEKRLADKDFFEMWENEMPQYGKFVYVPLPWHGIVERFAMRRSDFKPLRDAASIFSKLQFEKYDHFTTQGQSCFGQILKYSHNGGFEFENLDKLRIVFTSRIENLDRLTDGEKTVDNEVSIPLLNGHTFEIRPRAEERNASAFFAGSCTSPIRNELLPKLVDSAAYDMTHVYPCGRYTKFPRSSYIEYLTNSTWTLTPRGSFPAAYMMSETIQAGSLPVYIFGQRSRQKRHLPPINLIVQHLPFYNAGLDWRAFGHVVHAPDVPKIPQILVDTTNMTSRLALVKQIRPLFTTRGTYLYMLALLSHVARKNSTVPSL